MDIIKVGLDFGTHQTKICIRTSPNEDTDHPIYEFFTFKDLKGNKSYFLPSVVQVNKDDTLSYGFWDSEVQKDCPPEETTLPANEEEEKDFDISKKAAQLYCQYATPQNTYEDIDCLVKMLSLYKEKRKQQHDVDSATEKTSLPADSEYFYRYFKQATFSTREWTHKISSETISVWFLSYVIFLLEEKYGTDFGVNMGIPVGEHNYEEKRAYASSILMSAYRLVEDVYHNNLDEFLQEKIDDLQQKTIIVPFSESLKKEYNINIYPEAYAGLTTLTSMGKLTSGMSLLADIGGGTTDISFFTITDNKPMIYRYWSIPKGLNYIAEKSGFIYHKGDIKKQAKEEVLRDFLEDERNIISILVDDLIRQWAQETRIDKSNLLDALYNRVIVYNGGGSTETQLVNPLIYFNDIKLMNANMWRETNLKDKGSVNPLCQLLTTAYGLSIGESDEEVTVSKFTELFKNIGANIEDVQEKEYTDKDQC